MTGLAWTGSNRSTSPMSRGRSAAELQASGCRARIRTWTWIKAEGTARRATFLHHAAVEERKGFGPFAPVATRPTYLGSNQAPSARLGHLSEEEGERVERSCRLVAWIKFRFRDGGSAASGGPKTPRSAIAFCIG